MSVGAPDNKIVEVEFTAGVWSDITQYVDWSAGVNTTFGRTTPYSQANPATMDLTLFNTDGRFTPGRSTLLDGSAHPYFPKVLPRRRIRFGYIIGATTFYRFTGYVSGWPPSFKNGVLPQVAISAVDRLTQLAKTALTTTLGQEIVTDEPLYYWPLTDGSGVPAAAEINGGTSLSATQITGTTATMEFGADGAGSGNGSAVAWTRGSSGNLGQHLFTSLLNLTPSPLAIEVWINPGLPTSSDESVLYFIDILGTSFIVVEILGTVSGGTGSVTSGIGSPSAVTVANGVKNVCDGNWHMLTFTYDVATGRWRQYVDGVLDSVSTTTGTYTVNFTTLYVGIQAAFGGPYQGSAAHLAVYNKVLSDDRITAHYNAGQGWLNETSDQRVERFLTAGGLTSADWDVDDSQVTLSSYDQLGQDIVTASQDVVTSEGGGSVFYVAPDGKATFRNRHARLNAAPVVTLDAAGDLDVSGWLPAFNADTLINQVVASRQTASGTATTQTVNDTDSQDEYEVTSFALSSYSQDDNDVRNNAQQIIVENATPAVRLEQITVDLWNSSTATIYQDLGPVRIGSLIRVGNIPPNALSASTLDLFVEGWSDKVTDSSYSIAFDTSPVGVEVPAVWGSFVWQPDSTVVLSTDLTTTSTTVVLQTPLTSARFTLASGSYPLVIKLDDEQIKLNAPPSEVVSGGRTLQTFTGCTRHVNGTTAATHTGAIVSLVPRSTWTF